MYSGLIIAFSVRNYSQPEDVGLNGVNKSIQQLPSANKTLHLKNINSLRIEVKKYVPQV